MPTVAAGILWFCRGGKFRFRSEGPPQYFVPIN
uniref:Uncharacterized protein n=1 Tax=Anguilla anguilla TaxID=7936 RepID=A0A0E9VB25_ANGAN